MACFREFLEKTQYLMNTLYLIEGCSQFGLEAGVKSVSVCQNVHRAGRQGFKRDTAFVKCHFYSILELISRIFDFDLLLRKMCVTDNFEM